MSRTIIIIGGLDENHDRSALLQTLRERTEEHDVSWDWVKADLPTFTPPKKPLRKFFARLQQAGSRKNEQDELVIVKLKHLHGKVQSRIYNKNPDPIAPPSSIHTSEDLVEWLFSNDSGLFGIVTWHASIEEAALVAILCKLVKNKAWNKDTRGHQWVKEEDLLNQFPVARRDVPSLRTAAVQLLPSLLSNLLLRKGGTQGKTPTEWSIRLEYVPAVKRTLLERSLNPLSAQPDLAILINKILSNATVLEIDDQTVSQRIRTICGSP